MKKLIVILTVLIMTLFVSIAVNANTVLVDFKLSDGTQVYIDRARKIKAQIPTEYQTKDREFRAVWMSQLVGDIPSITSKEAYIETMTAALNTLQEYNINAIVYHVRMMNDALYPSVNNPMSSYVQSVNFIEWDYLDWLIGEVHRRGMEFHAWLNPYRIQNGINGAENIPNLYRNYPGNPASDPEMLLVGSEGVILNPGEPQVRQFIVDTSMELIRNYDVDGIHFDDYFYIKMNQNTDLATYNKYKSNSNTTNIEDWRREQVDLFIKGLRDEMTAYNKANNRQVQLGISPSGIWRNGNGVVSGYDGNGNAITNGSDTVGFSHYDYYLYSDTKKWIDNEWIDYIVPQVYWAFTLNAAMHGAIVNWWQQIVKYKNVNLYIGMGLYMLNEDNASGDQWRRDPHEAANQALYSSQFENVGGMVIYQYKTLASKRNDLGVQRIRNEYWNKPSLNPEVKTIATVTPNNVYDVNVFKSNSGFVLSWDEAINARKYAIYRSEGIVDTNNPNQLVGIVGYDPNVDMVVFHDKVDNSKNYNYAVVSVSGTNTKGEAKNINSVNAGELPFEFASLDDLKVINEKDYLFEDEIQLGWSVANISLGSKMEYELQYSFDQVSWFTESTGRMRFIGSMYTHTFKYPYYIGNIYYRVKGINDVDSIYSNTISVQVTPDINGVGDYVDFLNTILNKRISDIFNN